MDASLIAGTVTGLALLYAANLLLGCFEVMSNLLPHFDII